MPLKNAFFLALGRLFCYNFCMLKNLLALSLVLAFFFAGDAIAQKGFSIEGGLIYDRPTGSGAKPFTAIKSGLGYMGNIGYDFVDRAGLELGVLHSSHDYELAVINNAVSEESADKTTIFLKARGIPYRREKYDLVIAAGIGYFDISGKKLIQDTEVDADFSGVGLITNLDFRYNVTSGLAISLYFGANFVNYSRYELLGYKADFGGKMPGGNSLNWGFTLFHRIGVPQI